MGLGVASSNPGSSGLVSFLIAHQGDFSVLSLCLCLAWGQSAESVPPWDLICHYSHSSPPHTHTLLSWLSLKPPNSTVTTGPLYMTSLYSACLFPCASVSSFDVHTQTVPSHLGIPNLPTLNYIIPCTLHACPLISKFCFPAMHFSLLFRALDRTQDVCTSLPTC